MPDPYLTARVESVEEGGDPVRISAALHSGAVVSGFVRRSQFFVSITKDVTLTTLKAVESRQPRLPSLPALDFSRNASTASTQAPTRPSRLT